MLSLLAMFFGDYLDRGGGLVHLKGEKKKKDGQFFLLQPDEMVRILAN